LFSQSSDAFGRKGSKVSTTSPPVKDVLIEAEKSETAGVKLTVYVDYFRAGGWGLAAAMLIFYILFQGTLFVYLIRLWSLNNLFLHHSELLF